jgi:octaprenyl-diphosphate synthase
MGSGALKPSTVRRAAAALKTAAHFSGRNGDPHTQHLLRIIQPIAPHLAAVESALMRQVDGFDVSVQEYIRYAVEGHGKRLRPVLALLSGGACGKIGRGHIDLSVIVEMIHLATLVHDDVIDEAQMRRSKPTANSRWGNQIPVLVGDCLFAHSLKLAASYSTTEVCRKISEATNTVCAGEILQTRERFNFDLTLEEYLRVVEMKTAALFAVSCELGAYLSGAGKTETAALRDYGLALGTAYQIYDDCVDIFGDEPQAGKSLGTDADSGKLTLPLLLVLREAEEGERNRLRSLLQQDAMAHREQIASAAARNGAVTGTMNLIEQYTQRAVASLKPLKATEFSESLRQLPEFLWQRSRAVMPRRSSRSV